MNSIYQLSYRIFFILCTLFLILSRFAGYSERKEYLETVLIQRKGIQAFQRILEMLFCTKPPTTFMFEAYSGIRKVFVQRLCPIQAGVDVFKATYLNDCTGNFGIESRFGMLVQSSRIIHVGRSSTREDRWDSSYMYQDKSQFDPYF